VWIRIHSSLFTPGDDHFKTEKEKVFPPPLLEVIYQYLASTTTTTTDVSSLLFSSNNTTGHEEGGGGVRSHELDDDNQTRLRWNARKNK